MSDFLNKYPYTDFHELNLDWVIARVKKLTEDWLATQEEWHNTQEQWQQLYDYVHDYFANLDVQDEINNKINQMILDGTFLSIVAPTINQTVVDATTSWLADHITQPTTPAIDSSLSINGAAADARRTGLLGALQYDATADYDIDDFCIYNGFVYKCKTAIVGGETWNSAHWTYTHLGDELKNLKNISVCEREATNGVYNSFNDIVKNGVYLLNSTLTDGYEPGSYNYEGALIVELFRTGNNYGVTQTVFDRYNNTYRRVKWNTWSTWKHLTTDEEVFKEKVPTTGVYTDFNDITENGCYIVNSSLANGINGAASDAYQGKLNVFSFTSNVRFGISQMYIDENGEIYLRSVWNYVWTSWTRISLENDVNDNTKCLYFNAHSVNLVNPRTFLRRGYRYDFADGTTEIADLNAIMSDVIYIGALDEVYIRQTFSTTSTHIILCYCFDSAMNYLGYVNTRFVDVGNDEFVLPLAGRTYYIRIYSNNSTVTPQEICVATRHLEAFAAYGSDYDMLDSNSHIIKHKRVVNFGDSIFGIRRPPLDVSTYIAKKTGATVYNVAFGGTRMAAHSGPEWDAFSMYQLASAVANNDFTAQDAVISDPDLPDYFAETLTLLKSIDFSEIDIITIAFGTNDFTAAVTISDPNDPYDTSTYEGALRTSIETLLGAYPHLKIFTCTPIWRFWQTGGVYDDDSDDRLINGVKLTAFVDSCKDVSAEYHLTCIDNYNELGLNKYNRTNYFSNTDGTHPNHNGIMLIADHIANKIF